MSSAKIRTNIDSNVMLLSIKLLKSRVSLQSIGESASPCLSPIDIYKHADSCE